jgi:type IV fimbrial biogenesis protein FimT
MIFSSSVALTRQCLPQQCNKVKFSKTHKLLAGFTLIELMVTLAVLVVLITLALPNFQELIQSNRIQSATAELQTSLAMARGEAIKRGGDAKVTLLAKTVGGATSWSNGHTVFVDRSALGATLAQLATESTAAAGRAGEMLLDTPAPNVSVSFTEEGSSQLNYVTYNGLGRTVQSDNVFLAATYRFTSAAGATVSNSRCLYLSRMGRTRTQRYDAVTFAGHTPTNTCPAE